MYHGGVRRILTRLNQEFNIRGNNYQCRACPNGTWFSESDAERHRRTNKHARYLKEFRPENIRLGAGQDHSAVVQGGFTSASPTQEVCGLLWGEGGNLRDPVIHGFSQPADNSFDDPLIRQSRESEFGGVNCGVEQSGLGRWQVDNEDAIITSMFHGHSFDSGENWELWQALNGFVPTSAGRTAEKKIPEANTMDLLREALLGINLKITLEDGSDERSDCEDVGERNSCLETKQRTDL